jgi:rare lipoprotein A (peptidoglycan hydrolase)
MPTINQTSLRWALALAAILALMAGAATGAKAATGGASSSEGGSSSEEVAYSPYRYGGASWYGGPSLWGHKTACGKTLRPHTLGVAHKTLPCGTTVKFVYHGHVLVTQVIDRGPYVKGRAWDLTKAASEVLGLEGVGRVRYAVALNYAGNLR